MTHYPVYLRDWIFVHGYRSLSLAKNMGRKYKLKNMSKILSSKYSHKLLDHAKKSATDALQNCFKNRNWKNGRNN